MKDTFKVKAILQITGIIALMVIIGFSMAACTNSDDASSSGGGGGGDITEIPANYLNTFWINNPSVMAIEFTESTTTFLLYQSKQTNMAGGTVD